VPEDAADRPQVSAYDRAARLLGQRPHFRAELRRKLIQKGHAEDEVDGALARLAERGYLDDERLAAAEAERLRERRGLARAGVAAELRRKGAGESAVVAATAGGDVDDERRSARTAAERWLRTHPPRPAALARHLDRKGYPASLVLELLAELTPERNEPADGEL
jgi:regulatory protein